MKISKFLILYTVIYFFPLSLYIVIIVFQSGNGFNPIIRLLLSFFGSLGILFLLIFFRKIRNLLLEKLTKLHISSGESALVIMIIFLSLLVLLTIMINSAIYPWHLFVIIAFIGELFLPFTVLPWKR